ncbi:MAG: dipeptidase family protein [Clostridia bacterium]|jgi:membrane dipeptidase|nr:dipeptidase family protein [Clostridia bacterium]
MLIDLHCDTILECHLSGGKRELYKSDLCVDIEKMKEAGSLAQIFALYVDMKGAEKPMQNCMDMLDLFYNELDKNKDTVAFAACYEDIEKNKREGKMSALLSIEEGAAINGSIANLRNFYRLGVRLMTLLWNYPNQIGFPNFQFEHKDKGLTEFGMEVVAEMNRLGMIIDVSHLSDGGFYDVARLSHKPFVASHSNARACTMHERNLTDDMIKILAEKGGIMGLNIESFFLSEGAPTTISTVADMVRHLKHIKNIGGIDVMAIGTDFDGTMHTSEIAHLGEMEKLSAALKKDLFSEEEIDKIYYKNALRIIKEIL